MNIIEFLYKWIISKPNTASFIAGMLTTIVIEYFLK